MRQLNLNLLRHMSLVLVLLGSMLLVGCGKKGPLYLPDQQTDDNKPAKKTSQQP